VAHHMSAEKRNRQSKKRTARNKGVKTGIRSMVKKLEQALEKAKPEELQALLKQVVSTIDRAYTKGVLKRSSSSRKISQAVRKAAAKK
jgi:small subunit ribosomal protein S20